MQQVVASMLVGQSIHEESLMLDWKSQYIESCGVLTLHTTRYGHPNPPPQMTLAHVCGTLSYMTVPIGNEELAMSQDQLDRDISTDRTKNSATDLHYDPRKPPSQR